MYPCPQEQDVSPARPKAPGTPRAALADPGLFGAPEWEKSLRKEFQKLENGGDDLNTPKPPLGQASRAVTLRGLVSPAPSWHGGRALFPAVPLELLQLPWGEGGWDNNK